MNEQTKQEFLKCSQDEAMPLLQAWFKVQPKSVPRMITLGSYDDKYFVVHDAGSGNSKELLYMIVHSIRMVAKNTHTTLPSLLAAIIATLSHTKEASVDEENTPNKVD